MQLVRYTSHGNQLAQCICNFLVTPWARASALIPSGCLRQPGNGECNQMRLKFVTSFIARPEL